MNYSSDLTRLATQLESLPRNTTARQSFAGTAKAGAVMTRLEIAALAGIIAMGFALGFQAAEIGLLNMRLEQQKADLPVRVSQLVMSEFQARLNEVKEANHVTVGVYDATR